MLATYMDIAMMVITLDSVAISIFIGLGGEAEIMGCEDEYDACYDPRYEQYYNSQEQDLDDS